MKRDQELFREILLRIEEKEAATILQLGDLRFENKSAAEVMEHIQLLQDANMIDATLRPGPFGHPHGCLVRRLTNKGHDFLDAARNPGVWKKVKDEMAKRGVSAGIDLTLALLKYAMRHNSGLPPEPTSELTFT